MAPELTREICSECKKNLKNIETSAQSPMTKGRDLTVPKYLWGDRKVPLPQERYGDDLRFDYLVLDLVVTCKDLDFEKIFFGECQRLSARDLYALIEDKILRDFRPLLLDDKYNLSCQDIANLVISAIKEGVFQKWVDAYRFAWNTRANAIAREESIAIREPEYKIRRSFIEMIERYSV